MPFAPDCRCVRRREFARTTAGVALVGSAPLTGCLSGNDGNSEGNTSDGGASDNEEGSNGAEVPSYAS